MKEMVISVLHFTALLIEHSYARHIYNSMEVGNVVKLLLYIINVVTNCVAP